MPCVVRRSWLAEIQREILGCGYGCAPVQPVIDVGVAAPRHWTDQASWGPHEDRSILTRAGAVSFAARARRQSPASIVARAIASAAFIGALICVPGPVAAQFTQQGPKLVGSGNSGAKSPLTNGQGRSVAVSADGNTAIIGGPSDNGNMGAAWVFTRSNGVWTQQGSKLIGAGATNPALQGNSVALSADGNTAIIGGPDETRASVRCGFSRAAMGCGPSKATSWSAPVPLQARSIKVFRSRYRLTATPRSSAGPSIIRLSVRRGFSRAAMGRGFSKATSWSALVPLQARYIKVFRSQFRPTAILPSWVGTGQLKRRGAWVFTHSNGVWTQQGNKLVGTGAVGPISAGQGQSVALSADGNTAIIGGPGDNTAFGAAWVFTRSGGVWTQQGAKLVGTGVVGLATQFLSVALSADGNTVVAGADLDNNWGRRGVGIHPQRWGVDPAGRQTGRHRRC